MSLLRLVSALLLVLACTTTDPTPDAAPVSVDAARAADAASLSLDAAPASDAAGSPDPDGTADAAAATLSIKTRYFGDVTLADRAVALMDGGLHGIAGHTIVLAADGSATWERRTGSVSPAGKEGMGSFTATAAELATVAGWRDQLWPRAASGRLEFYGASPEPPRWVWAIVFRQGGTIRVIEGSEDRDETRGPLDWLRTRVDSLSEGKP